MPGLVFKNDLSSLPLVFGGLCPEGFSKASLPGWECGVGGERDITGTMELCNCGIIELWNCGMGWVGRDL